MADYKGDLPTHAGRVTIIYGDSKTFRTKLVAARHFEKGSLVGNLAPCAPAEEQNFLSVQVGPKEHVLMLNDFQFANHGCDPNISLDFSKMEVIALRDLQPGDELTWFYPSYEWDMCQPFECWCGASGCLKKVQGAKYIPDDVLQQYALADHIRRLKSLHEGGAASR